MSGKKKDAPQMWVRPMEKLPAKPVVLLLIVIAVAVCVFPLYWLAATSVKTRIDFLALPPKFFHFTPTLKNFQEVLSRADFARAYRNSLTISSTAIFLSLLLGLPASYGLSRFRFHSRGLLSFWILSTRFIPPVVVVIPFYLIFRTLNLINTLRGMVIIHLVAALPLVIWIMHGFFKDIPQELEESAVIDGASPPRVFVTIVLPLISPGIVATSVIALNGSWNEMIYSLILTSPATRTLPVAIYNFVSFEQVAWGNMCAAGVLAIAPIMIFTAVIQKYLVTGLTFGAVKS